jgi:hypothetical protein
MHENNHSTRSVYSITEHVNAMFCVMGALHDGPVWSAVLVAMRFIMKRTFVRTFRPVSQENLEDTWCLLEVGYLRDRLRDEEEGDGAAKKREQLAENFVSMFNGNTKRLFVCHKCCAGCCKSREESLVKCWAAYQNLILQHLPPTPKMSGWTLLNSPSRFFFLVLSLCGLFRQAWMLVHKKVTIDDIIQESRESMQAEFGQDLSGLEMGESTFSGCDPSDPNDVMPNLIVHREDGEEPSDRFCLPEEDLHLRDLRARSKKGTDFIDNPESVPRLSAALLATAPQEAFMHSQFEEQKHKCWEGRKGPGELPLVKLAVPWKSPAVKAVSQVLRIMTTDPEVFLRAMTGSKHHSEVIELNFDCMVESASTLWLRTVLPYRKYPWLHALVLDPDVSLEVCRYAKHLNPSNLYLNLPKG